MLYHAALRVLFPAHARVFRLLNSKRGACNNVAKLKVVPLIEQKGDVGAEPPLQREHDDRNEYTDYVQS